MSRPPGVAARRWTPHARREWKRLCERVKWDGVELVEPDRDYELATAEEAAELFTCTTESFGLGEHAEAELRRQGRSLDDLVPRRWPREVGPEQWKMWGLHPRGLDHRRDVRDSIGVPALGPSLF